MKPIFSKESREVFDKLRETLTDEQAESIVGFGGDMYSRALVEGAVVTLAFAATPAIVYILNRALREHP